MYRSNAECIAESERQYNGYDSYNCDRWEIAPVKEKATLQVRGVVFTYHPKEATRK